jgi:class 3 adenylate cyclase
MFTDIVGYTDMMQTDEQKALTVIKHYNATLEKWVTQHGGRVANYYGDGSLCIFNSATAAVQCSVDIQKRTAAGTRSFHSRIGLHIGEVILKKTRLSEIGQYSLTDQSSARRIRCLYQSIFMIRSKTIMLLLLPR